MKNLSLVKPDERYKKSFENYVLAYEIISDFICFSKYSEALLNFKGYLNYLSNLSKKENLFPGEIPVSTFWLIDEEEVVGVVRIRHEEEEFSGHIGYDISPNFRNRGYGFLILTFALKEAQNLGLKKVILTCEINNIPSKKIIEKNGGKFLERIYDNEENEYLYRYEIRFKKRELHG
ncbi:MAG: GNAT family N-acetyltransferase [Fusobacteriaceae bacterium]